MRKQTLSIIIPCYNEEKTLANLLAHVLSSPVDLAKEVVVIDDGSSDKSYSQIIDFSKKHNKSVTWKILKNSVNQGKGYSIARGILESTGDYVVIQDADLEYDPNEYPSLLEPLISNQADVVYGSRFMGGRPHRVLYFWHSVMNRMLTTLSNMFTNINLTDMETCYKVFRGDLIRSIAPYLVSKRFGFEPEVTAKLAKIKGIRFYEVGISYYGRTYEEGKKISWKDGLHAVFEIFRFNLFK